MPTKQEKRDLALTIAGEIHPGQTLYGTEESREEIANILASIENRFDLADSGRYATRSSVVKAPKQYSTWNTGASRQTAKNNYARYGTEIDAAVEDYYSGKLAATAPHATNYWSPGGMLAITGGARNAPNWAPAITNRETVGPHVFGTHGSLVDDLQKLDIDSRITAPYLGAPSPTGRGVSQADAAVNALTNNTNPAFSNEYAPGIPSEQQEMARIRDTLESQGYNWIDDSPWTDSFAPAPQYAPSTPSPSRFDGTFTRSVATNPTAAPVSPGTSNTGLAAAYRGLADTMAQAGIRGLGGAVGPQSPEGLAKYGMPNLEYGFSAPPDQGLFAPVDQTVTSAVPELSPPVTVEAAPTIAAPAQRSPAGYSGPLPAWDSPPVRNNTFGRKTLGAALGGGLGGMLLGPMGAVAGGLIGRNIAGGGLNYFPPAPAPALNSFPTAPTAPVNAAFNGGPGSDGYSDYGRDVADQSAQFAGAIGRGGLGLY